VILFFDIDSRELVFDIMAGMSWPDLFVKK